MHELLFDFDASFDSVHDRHVNVENDDLVVLKVLLEDHVQGVLTVFDSIHCFKLGQQCRLESHEQESVVVRQQTPPRYVHRRIVLAFLKDR
mmetsp:Transcript_32344/g.42804  ORF Transcript_32344/g.42804 Transcript_32344/m.42804 type:complete len:91 (+) Transcript_32344:500-772(+)